MRLIDADALYDKAEENYRAASGFYRPIYKGFVDDIADAPTVDATPVSHGRWTPYENEQDKGFHFCSECKAQAFNYEDGGEVVEVCPNYCHNCGAKMDLPEKEDAT